MNSGSVTQELEHPSPPYTFPSSHSSAATNWMPSPQDVIHVSDVVAI